MEQVILVLLLTVVGLPLAVTLAARIWFREHRKHIMSLTKENTSNELER